MRSKFIAGQVILICMPYFLLNIPSIYDSSKDAIVLSSGILFTYTLLGVIINSLDKKLFKVLFYGTVVLIHYGFSFISFFKLFEPDLRIKSLYPLIGLLIYFLSWLIIFKFPTKQFNVFLFFFLVTSLPNSKVLNSGVNFNVISERENPEIPDVSFNSKIILFILDEYSSPKELTILPDEDRLILNNKLVENGWVSRLSVFTESISTSESLLGLFDLGTKKGLEIDEHTSLHEKFENNDLYKFLEYNNIKIYNYGITDFGHLEPYTRLYIYPKNGLEEYMFNTGLIHFYHLYLKPFLKTFPFFVSPIQQHNNFIINNFNEIVKTSDTNSFFIFHLYMPHSPYVYYDEFNSKDLNGQEIYEEYWRFVNSKLIKTIGVLSRDNDCHVILTGDHGFRQSKVINPHITFASFLNIPYNLIDYNLKVQDIGQLVETLIKQ